LGKTVTQNKSELPEWKPATLLYRRATGFLRILTRMFFRRIEVLGLENVPATQGGVLVAWHPNGLVDPGLILARFPRQVTFGARDGLFKWPLLGALFRALGVVPVYRAQDNTEDDTQRQNKNAQSLHTLAEAIANGSFTALFPEGDSHDAPYVQDLKTGAARLYYLARQLQKEGEPPPVILPVGLHYARKALFRSHALVIFHPPITLPPALDLTPPENESDEILFEHAQNLTKEIEKNLQEVVHATESWEIHNLLHRARKIVRAERILEAGSSPGKAKIEEQVLGFSRIWKGYEAQRVSNPERLQKLILRVGEYHDDLEALGMEDEELDRDPRLMSAWLPIILVLQFVTVFFLLPPVLFVGYLVNVPPALALRVLSKKAAMKRKDVASIKILVGALIFPLTWLVYALLGAWGDIAVHESFPNTPATPWMTGVFTFLMCGISGAIAVRYMRVARETVRAVRIRLTRRMQSYTMERLRLERAELNKIILGLAQGLNLPGEVAPDGTVRNIAQEGSATETGPSGEH